MRWLPLALVLGCAFDADRPETVCRGPGECAEGEACVNHFCQAATAGDTAPTPPGDLEVRDGTLPPAPPPDAAPEPKPPAGCPPDTRCLIAVADTFVDHARPSMDFGDAPTLNVGGASGGERIAYVKLDLEDLDDIPAGAWLSLSVQRAQPPDSDVRLHAYEVDNNWDEETLVWRAQPIQYRLVGLTEVDVGPGQRVTIDLLAVVAEAMRGARGQISLALKTERDTPTSWVFGSRESEAPAWLQVEPR